MNVATEVTISDVTTHDIATLPKYFTLKFDAYIAAPSGTVDMFCSVFWSIQYGPYSIKISDEKYKPNEKGQEWITAIL